MSQVVDTKHINYQFLGMGSGLLQSALFSNLDFILTNEAILSCESTLDFEQIVSQACRSGGYVLGENNISQGTFTKSNGGVGCQYGTESDGVVAPLFTLKNVHIPKQIVISIYYNASTYGHFQLLYKTAKTTYSLYQVVDRSISHTLSDGIWVNNNTTDISGHYPTGVEDRIDTINIPEDTSNCFTDGEVIGDLIVGSAAMVGSNSANPIILREFKVLFE